MILKRQKASKQAGQELASGPMLKDEESAGVRHSTGHEAQALDRQRHHAGL